MAAAGGPEPEHVAALRRAGAPDGLPARMENAWLSWYAASRKIEFVYEGGVMSLLKRETQIATYAPLLRLGYSADDDFLTGTCVIQGCSGKASSAGMRVWYDDKLNVRNYIDHVYRVHLVPSSRSMRRCLPGRRRTPPWMWCGSPRRRRP